MIRLIHGNITSAEVDAIVNAANPTMLGGGGVDGAIHRAAGPKLLEACRRVPAVDGIRCPFGEARITSAGNLSAGFVIHTAGPIYRNEDDPQAVLRSSYENCFKLANENDCHSIAFPAISCGAYGFPIKEAGEIAADVCKRYPQLDIYFYLFDKEVERIWSEIDWPENP